MEYYKTNGTCCGLIVQIKNRFILYETIIDAQGAQAILYLHSGYKKVNLKFGLHVPRYSLVVIIIENIPV